MIYDEIHGTKKVERKNMNTKSIAGIKLRINSIQFFAF